MGKFDLPADYGQKMSNRAAFDATAVGKALLKLLAEKCHLDIGYNIFLNSVPINIGNGISIKLVGDDPSINIRMRTYEYQCWGYDINRDNLVLRFSKITGTLPLNGVKSNDINFISVFRVGYASYSQNYQYGQTIAEGQLRIKVKVEINDMEY